MVVDRQRFDKIKWVELAVVNWVGAKKSGRNTRQPLSRGAALDGDAVGTKTGR